MGKPKATYRHLITYAIYTALSLGCLRILSCISEAAFDARDQLKGVRLDLQATGGMNEYLLDFIQAKWIVKVLVAVSDWKVWSVVYAAGILVACL